VLTVLLNLLRFLLALVLIRILFRFVAGIVRGYRGTPRAAPVEVELVRDRVCNAFLPRSRAVVATIAGREEHFCSEACRDRALALLAVR